jgi:hypothetical protein
MDPENHQEKISDMGPLLDMRFWRNSGSIKKHEVLRGENLDLCPSNDMSFLGPSKHMRW